jgi:hypothetical protein
VPALTRALQSSCGSMVLFRGLGGGLPEEYGARRELGRLLSENSIYAKVVSLGPEDVLVSP